MLVVGLNDMPVMYVGEVDVSLEEVISRENEGNADNVELVARLEEIGVEVDVDMSREVVGVVDVSREVVGTVDDVSVAFDDVVAAGGGE